ncbi:MAG: hypothetical protein I8H87_13220 [Comamonadaceae bacterium]|nr:hypothetical protein [Comamonadaceae bacterium]
MIIAHVGGRPGIIFAVTGAMALVIGTLVKDHGFQYLLAATVLTGVLQIGSMPFCVELDNIKDTGVPIHPPAVSPVAAG